MKQTEKDALDLFFEGSVEGGDVLLLVSPLVATRMPFLGLHLLQSASQQAGITAHILYLNLLFSTIIGRALHFGITHEQFLFLKELLFASSAFGRSAMGGCKEKFLNSAFIENYGSKKKSDLTFLQVPEVFAPLLKWFDTVDWEYLESQATNFVQSTAQRISRMGYRVVGCSTTLGGLVPAIALLNTIKKENSNMITVIGGALCEGDMAEGIISLKTGVDYIFSGEGELTFPDFIKQILNNQKPKEKIIHGEPVKDLDTTPTPDYWHYFDQLKKLSTDRPFTECSGIPYETSRGCWYGKCTFCGYFGKNNFYREKSPGKVIGDIKGFIDQYGDNTIFMADSIMPFHYIETLLPRISKEISSINILYEVKANLTLEQVLSLKRAGVNQIVPGIESLSPSLLKRMRKGVTVRENIALLRYARSLKLSLFWHLLFGFPGDKIKEYEEMLKLLPLIRHLPPPKLMLPLRICRFNKYQMHPEMFGISNLRPIELYKYILPPHTDLGKIAYYFAGVFRTQSYENTEIIISLAKEFQEWKRTWASYEEMAPLEIILPTLHITRKCENEYILEDTRGLPGRSKRMVVDREQASILLVPRPMDSTTDYQWAVDAQLGVLMDSWYIPLATAEPELLQEFEQNYE